MKSSTLGIYKNFLATATQEQIEFVDEVYKKCEDNYECGGDAIVEHYEPEEILEEFKNMDDVKEQVKLRLEVGLNQRWGSDNDPQLTAYKRFEKGWE